jgi:hypothetical protein
MPAARKYILPENINGPESRDLEDAASKEYNSRKKMIERHCSYYEGEMPEPLKKESDGYNDNILFPKVQQLADKVVSFLIGDGVTFNVGKKTEQDAADEALAILWQRNHGKLLQHQLALNGALAGHVTVRIEPFENDFPRIVALDPIHVSVFWDEQDKENVLWYRLQYLYRDGQGKRVDYVNGAALDVSPDQWYEYVYTADRTRNWRLAEGPMLLPFPWSPIVDWQNLPAVRGYYGSPDVDKAVRLNDQLNFVASDYNRILKHHGHPKTVGLGMEAGDVVGTEVGGFFTVNKPKTEVEIFNLEMTSDLGAARELLNILNAEIWQSGAMVDPQSFKDKLGQLTNFGLRVLYTDALHRTATKRLLYEEGFEQINMRCLEAMGMSRPEDVETIWPEVLPQNKAETSTAIIAELGAGLLDKETARDALGYDNETIMGRLENEKAGEDTLGSRLLDAFSKGV